jgi:transposase InsO family protein
MQQQTIRIGHSQLPPPVSIIGRMWREGGGKGDPTRPPDGSDRPSDRRAAGADHAEIVPWAFWLCDRSSRRDAPFLPDLDRAFVNPASVFTSPHDVVCHPLLTIDCKREILVRWAWDEYLVDLADAEGMPEGEPSRLDEVKAALQLVNMTRSPDPAAPAAFIVPYHWDEMALAP